MSGRNWIDATMPRDAELTTIPVPSDDVVRDVAGVARSLNLEDDRVTTSTHRLAPPSIVLDQVLFNVETDPLHPMFINGSVVFTVAEPLEVEGRENDAVQWVRVKADESIHEVESVEIRAAIE